MSIIIHTEDIFPKLELELVNLQSNIIIVSAFVKIGALKRIDEIICNKSVNKKLLVRFRKEDIQFGSTDLELYEYCKENDWKLFIDFDLHSKIFVFDESRYILGSANVTFSGLGIAKNSNIETVCLGAMTVEEFKRIEELFYISQVLSKEIYNLMCEDIQDSKNDVNISNNSSWNLEIKDIFKKRPKQLWVSEMIFSSTPYDMNSIDRGLLGITSEESGNFHTVKEKFKKIKCYNWLLGSFEKEIYFGELTAKLHSAIIDNPTPYRKDIKTLLANMINWIKELEIEEIKIERPNYSQLIKKNGP